MKPTKEQLKNYGRFHLVDPKELDGLDEYAEWLESILHNPCNVWERDGEEFLIEIRQFVDRLNGLKIEIYPNEHAPPHFHVKSPTIDASFTIEECALLQGNIDNGNYRKVKFWYK